MGYLIRRPTTPVRAATIPPRNPFGDGSGNPPRFVASRNASKRAKSRANARAAFVGGYPTTVRVRNDQLGIVPVIAAAVPSVKDLAAKALKSLVSIVDPGKKRDAVREAQAETWFNWANEGSITAARTLHGGTHFPYTVKEKGFYQTRWNKLQASNATLAAQAAQAGDLSPVDAGQSTTPVVIPQATQDVVQQEINASHGVASKPAPGAAKNGGGGGGVNPLLLLAGASFLLRKLL
jgi:hypothetical protein